MADLWQIPEGFEEVKTGGTAVSDLPEGFEEVTGDEYIAYSQGAAVSASPEVQQAMAVRRATARANVKQTPEWWEAKRTEAVLADADPLAKAPALISEPYRAVASAATGIASTVARPFSKDAADYLAKTKEDMGRVSEAARKDDWSPWLSRMYGGAAESLAQSGIAAATGAGAAGIIGSFALTEGNQALYDAEQAGLKGADRIKYAVVQGAIEGGIAAAFNRFAPGLEKFIPQIAGGAMKLSGAQFLKMTAQELPEELLTELGHAITEASYGIDPNATSAEQLVPRMVDTIAQTIGTLGLAQGAARLAQNKQRLEQLETLRTTDSRDLKREAAKLGIEGTRSEIRKQVNSEAKQIQKEIQRAQEVQPEAEVRPDEKRTWEQTGQGAAKETPEVPVESVPTRDELDSLLDSELEEPPSRSQETERPVAQDVQAPAAEAIPADEARVEELIKKEGGRTGHKARDKRVEEAARKKATEEAELLQQYPPGTVLMLPTFNRKQEFVVGEDGKLYEHFDGQRGRSMGDNAGAAIRPYAQGGIQVISQPQSAQNPLSGPVADSVPQPASAVTSPTEAERIPTPREKAIEGKEPLRRDPTPSDEVVPAAQVNELRKANKAKRKGPRNQPDAVPAPQAPIQPPEAAPAKQAWEQTRKDYTDTAAMRVSGQSAGKTRKMAATAHKLYVREALAAGKPVPPEVLKDYPDLATQPQNASEPLPAPESTQPVPTLLEAAGKPEQGKKKSVRKEQPSEQSHHVVEYGGKSVPIDYVSNKKDEFKVAAQRVRDNLKTGEVGYVTAPDGKRYEITTASKKAKLLPTEQTSGETDIYRNRERKSLRTNETSPGETDTVSESRPPQGSGEDSEAESEFEREWAKARGVLSKEVDLALDKQINRHEAQARKDEGGIGIAVGAENANYRWGADAVREFRTRVRGGMDPNQAADEVKALARTWIEKHNARRPKDINWKRWEGAADHFIETALRTVVQAESKPAPASKPKSLPPKKPGEPQTHHVAEYGGKSIPIDYVDEKAEFKTAAQRVRDNLKSGEVGYVTAPDGKRYEITTASKKAKLLTPTKLQEAASAAHEEAKAALDELGEALKGKTYSNPMLDPALMVKVGKVVLKYAKANILDLGVVLEQLKDRYGQRYVDSLKPALVSEWNKLQATGQFKGMKPYGTDTPPPLPPKGDSGETTGTKNAKTDELRAKLGMEERPPVEAESVDQWQAEAARKMADDPQYAGKLAEELAENPRALNSVEEAVLGRHLRELKNRFKAGEDVLGEMRTAIEADERVGTIWSRAGTARKVELAADFSVEGLTKQYLRAVNETPSDEQMEKFAVHEDRIQELEGVLKETQQKLAQSEVDRAIAEAKARQSAPPLPAKRGTKRQMLEEKASAAVANFKEKWKALYQTGAVADPRRDAEQLLEITTAAVEVVKAYSELGVNSFLEFLSRVKKDFGKITADQRDAFRSAWNQTRSTDAPERRDNAEIGAIARKLTRFAVESGISERDAVVDAVHEELKGMGFEVSRSDTMAAMSGYGDFRELSKDEVSVKIRGINGELQQILKLEDMQAGQAPKKTGVERREPTDEERRLIKLVNEGKKRGGYKVTDPAKQLKSALGAAKTSIRHRITDLENAIAKREKIVSGQTKLTPDAELTALQKQRDQLNEQYKAIFPAKKSVMSESARLKMAEKLLDRLIAETQADLASRQFEPQKKGKPLTSPEIEAKRKQLAKLRESLKAAKQAAADAELAEWEGEGGATAVPKGKKPLTDAQRLKARQAAIERQIEELQADLKAGRLNSEAKAEPLSSPEIESRQQQLELLKATREQARAASPEYQAKEAAKQLARYKQDLQRQLALWEQRRAEAAAGILPSKRKPSPVDKEILETKYQIEQVKRHAEAEIEEAARAQRGPVGKALGFSGDLLDVARAIQTGYEMSAVLRQGAYYTLGFPKQAAKGLGNSVRAAVSRRADFAIHDDLMKRPNHVEYTRGGLETTAADGPLSHREEMIRSRIASWLSNTEGFAWAVPRWAAEGLLGGERAFRAFTNTMRADLFDYMKASVDASRPGTWSEDDAKVVANASNVFSGRGKLPAGQSGVGLSRIFYAPRWVWSRAQVLTGQPLWKGNSATRKAVGKVYVRAALGYAAYQLIKHAIYSLTADDDDEKPQYELDMRSSDFNKTRLGETRIDSGAGLSQLMTLAARVATGETKRADGKIVPIRGDDVPYGADDTADVLQRFLRTKLAPLPSGVIDWIVGKNVIGEKATVGKIVTDRVLPMTWRDIWDAEKELNVKQGTVAAIEAFFGAGVSTYGPQTKFREADEAGRQEIIAKDLKHLTWDAPDQPAYAKFLTDEQREHFRERRVEKRQQVLLDATFKPVRKNYKSDETYQEAIESRDKNIGFVQEMKAEGVTRSEAVQLLRKRYKGEGLSDRLVRLKEIYGE